MVARKFLDLDYSNVLHVAPERAISKWLQSVSNRYLSIDLCANAMARMDITDLQLKSRSQSLVWASHVLEHVEDDHKAISELNRILVRNGVVLIQVPIWRVATFEDFTKSTSEERQKHFFQEDHVRLYGLDIVDRFTKKGFIASTYRAQDFGPEKMLKHGMSFASTNEVFIFRKKSEAKAETANHIDGLND
jgi:predicted SAM-dependent methyltransferase